ncbi:MAG: NfeD family protein [Anaerosomatales bacterium]|nr:NfeD family protein [Anaerosomatales bacterium]MDT8434315.1 NfeD family protein [Anaerosomatales bacterium]
MGDPNIWFWVWVLLAAFLLIAEIFTAGFFMLPFGIGAAVAALMEFLGVSVGWQWVAFVVVSALMLIVLRRYADRITHEPPMRTGVDRLVGKSGVVIEELTPDSRVGMVRIEREEWRADAPGNEPVPVGTRVVVDRVDGTHLVVHPEV